MGRRGGVVIGSKEAVEKICSQCRRFMKYHSLLALLYSVIKTAAPDVELEAQVG